MPSLGSPGSRRGRDRDAADARRESGPRRGSDSCFGPRSAMLARQRAPGGGMDVGGSGEVGERLGLSCGGRTVTCNLSARRSSTGALKADGNRCDGLAHAEAGHALGAGGEGGWRLRTHMLRRPDATERAANDRGVQLSAMDRRARRDSLGRHETDRLANERTLLMLNASKMVTGTDLDVSQPMVMGGAQGRRRRSHLPLDQADVAETRAVAQCDRHHPPGC